MGWTSPEAKEMFQTVAKFDAERRTRTRREVSEGLQTVSASQKTESPRRLSSASAGRSHGVRSAGTKTTHPVIECDELGEVGGPNRAAREHLGHLGKTCDVTELLRGYAEKARR
jgi:hypothetical protein